MVRQITAGLLLTLLSVMGVSWGQSYTVCPQGCFYTSIQEAINDAFPGDTITVGPGTYKEHVEIREIDLQLIGAGADQVTLELVAESVRVGEERQAVGLLIANSAVTLKGFTIKGTSSLWFKNAEVQLKENLFRGEGRGYSSLGIGCLVCVEGGLEFIAKDNRFEDYDGSWTIDSSLLKKGYALVRLRTDLAVLRRNSFTRLKGLAIAVMTGQAILEENRFEKVWRAVQVGRPGRDPQIPEAFAQLRRNRLQGEGTTGDGVLIYDEALLEGNSISEFPGCAVWQSQPEFERQIRQIIVTDILKHFLMVAAYGAVEELPQASVLGKENSISTNCGSWCRQTYAQVLCPDQRFYPVGFGGGR